MASVSKDVGADISNLTSGISTEARKEGNDVNNLSNSTPIHLMWIRGNINGQYLDMMLDSGASTSCIAQRCVTASPYLKDLPRKKYSGLGLYDVSGNSLSVSFEIETKVVIGTPPLEKVMKFIVVDNLPYSCILGMNYLGILDNWGMDNGNRCLKLDSSMCPVFSRPQCDSSINLLTQSKCTLLPGEQITLSTTPKGPGLNPFRPFTDFSIVTEGNSILENRKEIVVVPAINTVSHKSCANVPVTVMNISTRRITVGKGSKIARCSDQYDFVETDDFINSITSMDPVDILCSEENYVIYPRKKKLK